MSFAFDASVALSWCFEDEHNYAVVALLDRVTEMGAVVPPLWPLEVLNGLLVAEGRRWLDMARRRLLSGFLRELPVTLDHATSDQAWTTTLHLAERFRLTIHDAVYLEPAQRRGLPLASRDRGVRAAGSTLWVAILETE